MLNLLNQGGSVSREESESDTLELLGGGVSTKSTQIARLMIHAVI